MKKKLLISFSGGETSAYMTQWLIKNKSDEYEFEIVFANTGQENEETLIFINEFSKLHGFKVVWVESVINYGYIWNNKKYNTSRKNLDRLKYILRKRYGINKKQFNKNVVWTNAGTTHKIVNFETASRNGEPFEEVIKKYGIPNKATPHCNRDLKLSPINSYIRSIGWKKHFTAIGIRIDEIDRMNDKRKEKRIIYPLITDKPMTKEKINFWFKNQSFRLNLKGYQGNCKTCWKKSDKKLFQIAKENINHFDFMLKMESKYMFYIPQTRRKSMIDKGVNPNSIVNLFFMKNRSAKDIIEQSKSFFGKVLNDSENYDNQLDLFDLIEKEESCDIFSNCGDL